MNTGQVISGAAHAGLIGWLVFGGVFRSDPLPLDVTDVSVISTEAFEAMSAGGSTPATPPTEIAQPEAPQPQVTEVTPPAVDPETEVSQPDPVDAPAPEVPPEPVAPQPEPEIADDVAALPVPDAPQIAEPAVSPMPVPRPADRVAPEIAETPDPDTTPDPVERQATRVEESADQTAPAEEQEATAPEEASDQIVTEADAPSGGPLVSLRPPAVRPAPPAPARTAEPETEPVQATNDTADAEQDNRSAAVEDALRSVLGDPQSTQPTVPQGPPLSASERDAFRFAVSPCWNRGTLSSEALRTTVTVGVDMEANGMPIIGSIRLVGSSNNSDAATRQAYEAARRAIIRCARGGYDLPAEKYDQWREIEMTFNPDGMRIE